MSSKKKRGAFYHFMATRKEELEAQGLTFRGGLKAVADFVSDEWKSMSADEKKLYDLDKKKDSKTETDPPKFANPAEKARWEDKQKMELEQALAAEIGILVQHPKIKEMRFVLIDFNIWGADSKGNYVPAEIGILAFSLKEGIIDNFGTIIDPREIPLGMGFEIFGVSDALDLPRPPFDPDLSGKFVRHLMSCIFWFLKKHGKDVNPGYLFCRRESTDIVHSCLKWICNKNETVHKFKVYPFEHLVLKLSELNKEKQDDNIDKAVVLRPRKFPSFAVVSRAVAQSVSGNSVENKTGLHDSAENLGSATASALCEEATETPTSIDAEETFMELDEQTVIASVTEEDAESVISLTNATAGSEDASISELSVSFNDSESTTSVSAVETGISGLAIFSKEAAETASVTAEVAGPEIEAPSDGTTSDEKGGTSGMGFPRFVLPPLSADSKRQWSFKFWKEEPPLTAEEREREKWKRVRPDGPIQFTDEEKAYYRKLMEGPAPDPLTEVRNVLDAVGLYRINHLACFHHMENTTMVHKCALSKVNYYTYNALQYLMPKFGIPPTTSAHYPMKGMVKHETAVHSLMLINWGLDEQRSYPSYLDPEKRKKKDESDKALVEARTFHTHGPKLEDRPLSHIPPLFRPKRASPRFVIAKKTE